ncbi:hypothetical protein [Desulfocurvus sp. DL9XJH121]
MPSNGHEALSISEITKKQGRNLVLASLAIIAITRISGQFSVSMLSITVSNANADDKNIILTMLFLFWQYSFYMFLARICDDLIVQGKCGFPPHKKQFYHEKIIFFLDILTPVLIAVGLIAMIL